METALNRHINTNRDAFSHYNMVRMREAIRYLGDQKLDLFLKIPFLLHINHPRYPGCVTSKSRPYGIWNFESSGFYKNALSRNLFSKSVIPSVANPDRAILGMYHIGSLGTFTQSSGSDFDYWLIIDKQKFTSLRYADLTRKCDDIVRYAGQKYGQQVSFFIMDHKDVRHDKYLPLSGRESLTAPRIFLKEEFYRTFLMVAGKIPLWAVLPVKNDAVSGSADISLQTGQILKDHPDLIDLGQILSIPRADILKGLLWHICKSTSDPVKALIKATMIFSYGFGRPQPEILCDVVKQGYARSGIDDYQADPYKVVFDQILKFHEREDPDSLNLIKSAIFYRLCGFPDVRMPSRNTPKRILLDKYIRIWQLDRGKVKKLLSYSEWSESEKRLLEHSFVQRLAAIAGQVQKKEKDIDFSADLEEERNWTLLKNKTRARLNRAKDKIRTCSVYLRRKEIVHLHIEDRDGTFILDLTTRDGENINSVMETPSLFSMMGWILENQLYRRQKGAFSFQSSNALFLSTDQPMALDQLYLQFACLKPLTDDCYEQPPVWCHMAILMGFHQTDLTRAEMLISNSWGELFSQTIDLSKSGSRPEQVRVLAEKMGEFRSKDLRCTIWQYAANHDSEIVYQVKSAYSKYMPVSGRKRKKQHKLFLDQL